MWGRREGRTGVGGVFALDTFISLFVERERERESSNSLPVSVCVANPVLHLEKKKKKKTEKTAGKD